MAQSCHVAFAFAREHPDITHHWMDISNYIVIVNIENESKLLALLKKAIELNIVYSIFKEEDLDNQLTAIALAPGDNSRRICSSLPLALKPK